MLVSSSWQITDQLPAGCIVSGYFSFHSSGHPTAARTGVRVIPPICHCVTSHQTQYTLQLLCCYIFAFSPFVKNVGWEGQWGMIHVGWEGHEGHTWIWMRQIRSSTSTQNLEMQSEKHTLTPHRHDTQDEIFYLRERWMTAQKTDSTTTNHGCGSYIQTKQYLSTDRRAVSKYK